MIYLASPYTHERARVRHARFMEAMAVSAQLIKDGEIVFSPIVHCHEMALIHEFPTTFEFWQTYCLGMLSVADKLLVLRLIGWQQSRGVQAEIAYAESNSIPIEYR